MSSRVTSGWHCEAVVTSDWCFFRIFLISIDLPTSIHHHTITISSQRLRAIDHNIPTEIIVLADHHGIIRSQLTYPHLAESQRSPLKLIFDVGILHCIEPHFKLVIVADPELQVPKNA